MLAYAAKTFALDAAGNIVSVRSKRVRWEQRPQTRLTELFKDGYFAAPTAAAMAIGTFDSIVTANAAFCAELPRLVLDVVNEDPHGATAVTYRRYLRKVLLPEVDRVANILIAHSSTIEWCAFGEGCLLAFKAVCIAS